MDFEVGNDDKSNTNIFIMEPNEKSPPHNLGTVELDPSKALRITEIEFSNQSAEFPTDSEPFETVVVAEEFVNEDSNLDKPDTFMEVGELSIRNESNYSDEGPNEEELSENEYVEEGLDYSDLKNNEILYFRKGLSSELKAEEENSVDFGTVYKMCRLCACLLPQANLRYLFKDDEIEDMISRLLPDLVKKDDGLPQDICRICADKLRSCANTVRSFMESNRKLKELFQIYGSDLQNGEEDSKEKIKLIPLDGSKLSNWHTPEDDQSFSGIEERGYNIELESKSGKSCSLRGEDDSYSEVVSADEDSLNRNSCTVCGDSFSSTGGLLYHKFKAHNLGSRHNEDGHSSSRRYGRAECVACEKVFQNVRSFVLHLAVKHQMPLYACNVCGAKCVSESNLRLHQEKHSTNYKKVCDICFSTFDSLIDLKRHRLEHKSMYMYKCTDCEEKFMTWPLLNRHKREVHNSMNNPELLGNEFAFPCDECGKAFHKKANLMQHKLSHFKEKVHKCNFCKSAFNRKSNLNQHIKMKHEIVNFVSSSGEIFKCQYCGMVFSDKIRFQVHVGRHTGDKEPIKCDICRRSFICNSKYLIHMRMHTGERPFKCSYCPDAFRTKGTMKQHEKSHCDVYYYTCPFCEMKFKRLYSFNMHKIRHLGIRPHSCPDCGRKFTLKLDMKKHRKTHYKNFYTRKDEVKEFPVFVVDEITAIEVEGGSKDQFLE